MDTQRIDHSSRRVVYLIEIFSTDKNRAPADASLQENPWPPWVTCYSRRCQRVSTVELEDTRDFNTRYLTLMEEGGCAPNVTFGSNCSVKNVVREGANESTRVVNSYRRDEISIDPSRGSEISK